MACAGPTLELRSDKDAHAAVVFPADEAVLDQVAITLRATGQPVVVAYDFDETWLGSSAVWQPLVAYLEQRLGDVEHVRFVRLDALLREPALEAAASAQPLPYLCVVSDFYRKAWDSLETYRSLERLAGRYRVALLPVSAALRQSHGDSGLSANFGFLRQAVAVQRGETPAPMQFATLHDANFLRFPVLDLLDAARWNPEAAGETQQVIHAAAVRPVVSVPRLRVPLAQIPLRPFVVRSGAIKSPSAHRMAYALAAMGPLPHAILRQLPTHQALRKPGVVGVLKKLGVENWSAADLWALYRHQIAVDNRQDASAAKPAVHIEARARSQLVAGVSESTLKVLRKLAKALDPSRALKEP